MAPDNRAIITISLMVTLGWAFNAELPPDDPLQHALDGSRGLDYLALYRRALAHLDMEDIANVTTQQLRNMSLQVGSTDDVCNNTIFQNKGIPWDDGNSSMRFTKESSYVKVSSQGVVQPLSGVSVSLWVKTPENATAVRGCTVLNLTMTAMLENSHDISLMIKRETATDGDKENYVLHGSDHIALVNAAFDRTSDWNMLSFTFNQSHVSLLENGYNNNTPTSHYISMPQDRKISLTLNGDGVQSNGCSDLEVDQVALWDYALSESELIALRVQPFNTSSCPNATQTTPHPESPTPSAEETVGTNSSTSKLEEYSKEVKTAPAPIASEALQSAYTDIIEKENLTLDEITSLQDILVAVDERGLLNNAKLTVESWNINIEAYVNIHSIMFDYAKKPEFAARIDVSSSIDKLETAMEHTFLDSNRNNKMNISSPHVDVRFFTLNLNEEESEIPLGKSNVTVKVPGSAFKTNSEEVLFMIFDKKVAEQFSNTLPDSWVSSYIISIQIANLAEKLTNPISLKFSVDDDEFHQILNRSLVPKCVYLDVTGSEISWKSDGVEHEPFEDSTAPFITCKTSHLTSFAVLLSPGDLTPHATLSALTQILLTISLICLLVTFMFLICLPEIGKTQRVQILKHFIVALFTAQLLFVVTTDLMTFSEPICKLSAVLSHYFWVATFTWMLVQGVQLYTKVRRLAGSSIKQIYYIAFAWGFPLPVAAIPILLFNDDYRERVTGPTAICWIPSKLVWFLAVPLLVIFCVNLGVTVMVMKAFLTVKVNKDKSNSEKLKSSMRAVIVMVPVLGLTWAFGFLLLIDQSEFFQYLFVILNCLQGLFVFLFHLVMNEDVRTAVLRRRNKVASNAENTIFTKVPPTHKKGEQAESMPTNTTKAPSTSDSSSNM